MVYHYEVHVITQDTFNKKSHISILIVVFYKSSLNLDLLITPLKPIFGNFYDIAHPQNT